MFYKDNNTQLRKQPGNASGEQESANNGAMPAGVQKILDDKKE